MQASGGRQAERNELVCGGSGGHSVGGLWEEPGTLQDTGPASSRAVPQDGRGSRARAGAGECAPRLPPSAGSPRIPPWAKAVINAQILEIMALIKLLCCLLPFREFVN